MKECPKKKKNGWNLRNRAQSSSIDLPERTAPKGDIFGTGGGENLLYAITRRQKQENSPYVVIIMIKVFTFGVYALLDQQTYFCNFLCWKSVWDSSWDTLPLYVSNTVGESILEKRVYRDCLISINQGWYSDVRHGIFWCHSRYGLTSCLLCINGL